MWYRNQEVDELLDLGFSLLNGPEREKVFGKLWDILNDDVTWIPLLEVKQLYGHDKNLKGITYSPGGYLNYLGRAYFE